MLMDSVDYLTVISPICAPFQWNQNCTNKSANPTVLLPFKHEDVRLTLVERAHGPG